MSDGTEYDNKDRLFAGAIVMATVLSAGLFWLATRGPGTDDFLLMISGLFAVPLLFLVTLGVGHVTLLATSRVAKWR